MTTPIDEYIRELHAATTGRVSRRPPRILREVRDHLEDAAASGEDEGLPRHEAEREAVTDFGDVDTVAPEYRAAIGLTRVRATAIALIALMSIQPFAWGWWEGHRPDSGDSGWLFPALNHAVEMIGTAYLIGCPALLLVCALLLRGRDPVVALTRVIGGFTVACAAMIVVLAIALNTSEPSVIGAAFTTTVVLAPVSAALVSAARGIRLATA